MVKSKKKRNELVKKLWSRMIDWIFPIFIVVMILHKDPTRIDMKITIDPVQIEIGSDFASDAPVS